MQGRFRDGLRGRGIVDEDTGDTQESSLGLLAFGKSRRSHVVVEWGGQVDLERDRTDTSFLVVLDGDGRLGRSGGDLFVHDYSAFFPVETSMGNAAGNADDAGRSGVGWVEI